MEQPPSFTPHRGETQSLLSVADYINLFMRYRLWFVIGLLLVMGLTFFTVRYVAMKFFRAESSFFINNRIPPEQLVGITDAQVFQPRQNESFQTAVLAQVAQRILTSNDLLTSAVLTLAQASPPVDLAGLLKINETDPELRRRLLMRQLQRDLIKVNLLESNGIAELTVELPDPAVAARLNASMLELLQREFSKFLFGYFIKARELYEQDLLAAEAKQARLAEELLDFERRSQFDVAEIIQARRRTMQEQLRGLTEQNVLLSQRVQNLRLATSPEALAAAQPIRIINQPEPPLKKSRPQTIVSTLISGVLYTFVFLTALMFLGIYHGLRSAGVRL